MGYLRENNTIGFRNYVAVLPSVGCANDVVKKITSLFPNILALSHRQGCTQLGSDKEQSFRTLAGLGKNPNIAAVLVVGMGCESIAAEELSHAISKSRKQVEFINVLQEGGLVGSLDKATRILKDMLNRVAMMEKVPCGVDHLTLGIKCGLTDTTSGLASNPATGIVAEKVVAQGGTVVFGETPEVIGAEHILLRRAVSEKAQKNLLSFVHQYEKRINLSGFDIRGANPSPGNIKGGITSIEEKSLGAIKKAGDAPLQDALKYGEIPTGKGLYFMDGPGRTPEALTGLNATGAQLIIFSTGGGSPAGTQISPVIKVTGNVHTAEGKKDHIDVDVSGIITGNEKIEQAGERIYDTLLRVASGQTTKAENYGYGGISVWNIGVHM